MRKLWIVLIVLFVFLSLGQAEVCAADSIDELKQENELLKQRTAKLEQEMAELKRMFAAQSQPQSQPQAIITTDTSTPVLLTENDYQKIADLAQKNSSKKPITTGSGIDVQLYGYIKADASYDTSRTYPGNFTYWVDNETGHHNDDEFNMTANHTRFGFNLTGPDTGDMLTTGKFEMDFYGNGTAENKPGILVRHAYLNFDWPDQQFSILAGQTWDIFSPLLPDTLNYIALWNVGNIGYRHPQIRVTKDIDLTDSVQLKLQGAIARTIGDDEVTATAGKSGEDAGVPTIQSRIGLTFPGFGYKPTTVGVSGHWGTEEYGRTSTSATSKRFDTWSINLDYSQPVNEWLSFKGEVFRGNNLNDFLGGIGQGVRSTTTGGVTTYHNEIATKGGWVQATIKPQGKFRYNLGFGVDDVDDGDINNGQRARNRSIYANTIYSLNKNAEVGFELSHWETQYKGAGSSRDLRAQMSFIYKF